MTLESTKDFYTTELEAYKTVSSKKAFLTRSRKQSEVWHDELVQAYNRTSQMLHGELVSREDIRITFAEIKLINNLYKSL